MKSSEVQGKLVELFEQDFPVSDAKTKALKHKTKQIQ